MSRFLKSLIVVPGVVVCLGSFAHADAITESRDAALAQTSVYRVGYPVEVSIKSGKGLGKNQFAANTEASKHYALGRLSHELSYVMPDSRTVYIGNDQKNGGLFRFVADAKGDLSAGELFVAKLTQAEKKDALKSSFTIEWISLGHARDAQIDAIISKGIKFSQIFKTAEIADNACPQSYTAIDTTYGPECVKLKTGNNLDMSADEIAFAASRLESARYAAMLGGTSEFYKMEGVSFDPKRNKLYVAISDLSQGMRRSSKLAGVDDDINLKTNRCGAVMQLSVGPDFVATDMDFLVAGGPFNRSAVINACSINNISKPDNIVMGLNDDTLLIAEDTSFHQNDVLWAYDLKTGVRTRMLTAPYGSEVTSPFYYKNIDDAFDYLVTVVQHPFGGNGEKFVLSDADRPAYVGFVAIPAKIQGGDSVDFKPLPFPTTDTEKRTVQFTSAMSLNGNEIALNGYQTLLRSGDRFGDAVFGRALTKKGKLPVNFEGGGLKGGVSVSPDHTTLHRTKAGELFSITQFENKLGMMYISSLDLDTVSGTLVVTGLKPVDLSATYGGSVFCAGIPTAWGTHLGGEERDYDARAFEAAGSVDDDFDKYLAYFGFNPKAK